jgi:hypothetical protein
VDNKDNALASTMNSLSSTVQSLSSNLTKNYYPKTSLYTKTEMDNKDNALASTMNSLSSTVQSLSSNLTKNYYPKTSLYTKLEVDNKDNALANTISDLSSSLQNTVKSLNNYELKTVIGNNSNGTYIKYSNGLMICIMKQEIKSGDWGNYMKITFPAVFDQIPYVSMNVLYLSESYFSGIREINKDNALFSVMGREGNNIGGIKDATRNTISFAIGKWK